MGWDDVSSVDGYVGSGVDTAWSSSTSRRSGAFPGSVPDGAGLLSERHHAGFRHARAEVVHEERSRSPSATGRNLRIRKHFEHIPDPKPRPGQERFIIPIFQALKHRRLAHGLVKQSHPLCILSSCGGSMMETSVWESFDIDVKLKFPSE